MSTVLISDDKAANRDLLATLMGFVGHRVMAAEDGLVALKLARSSRPDLIIADIVMPGLDGMGLVRALRTEPSLVSVPVILFTAHYETSELEAVAALGGLVRLLTKPAEPQAILEAVADALASPERTPSFSPNAYDREHLRLLNEELVRQVAKLEKEVEERKRAEELVRQQALEIAHMSRLTTMGQMASGLAHELGQPLAVIQNYASICLDMVRFPKPVDEVLAGQLQEIVNQTNRAHLIMQRCRAFARKRAPQRVPVELGELIPTTARFLEHELQLHRVGLEVDVARPMPRVMVDGLQIQQVLVNLMRNAAEAMSEQEPVTRQMVVRASGAAPGVAQVEVIDAGPGLEPGAMKKLFDPFFTTKSDGLGMGLNISRTIVEAHGGRLTARPNAERGMDFSFTLPTCDAQAFTHAA